MTRLEVIINQIKSTHSDCKKINVYYYGDIYDEYTNEGMFMNEFIGVSSYHDNFLDTSEDPDGWSLQDEIESWTLEPDKVEQGLYNLLVNIGRLN